MNISSLFWAFSLKRAPAFKSDNFAEIMRQLENEYQAENKTQRVNGEEYEQRCYNVPFCEFFKRGLATFSETNVFWADIVDREDLVVADRAGSIHKPEVDVKVLK